MAQSTERKTVQKKIVLDTIKSMTNHPTADMVYEELNLTYPTISKATVYRNLGQLAEKGVIRRISLSDGPCRYDYNTSEHYHVRCKYCGAVADVEIKDIPELKNLKDCVGNSSGYVITEGYFIFEGICPDCAAKSMENIG